MVYGRVSFGVGTVVSELSGPAPPVYLKCVGVVVSTVVKLTQVSVSIYCGGWGGGIPVVAGAVGSRGSEISAT